ncbi:MAG: hypothetical protein ACOYXB_02540 [Bacteroidota bacterium]
MPDTKRRFLVYLFLLVLSGSAFSQYNTYSPYTRFGLGELTMQGFGQNLAMGGTGLALRNNDRLNYLNPASYASGDSMSVLFDFGMNTTSDFYSTVDGNKSFFNANFHHVAFSTPVTKYFGLAAGIVPYSSIGYKIKQEYNSMPNGVPVDYYYTGDGGIMNFFVGGSFLLFKRISIGASMNYLMANISRQKTIDFPVNPYYASTTSEQNIVFKKPVYSLGIQYKETFKDKFFFSIGGRYDLESSINTGIYNKTYSSFTGNSGALNDSVSISPTTVIVQDTGYSNLIIPMNRGIGLAFGIPGKLTITGDYSSQDWSNNISGIGDSLTSSQSLRVGLELIPNRNDLRSYGKHIAYRVGGYYSDYYLRVNGYQLKDYGITFGVGLPLKGTRSTFNVAFTLGTRGTTENNLIKENYGIITFNVTLHDLWFIKRRFE